MIPSPTPPSKKKGWFNCCTFLGVKLVNWYHLGCFKTKMTTLGAVLVLSQTKISQELLKCFSRNGKYKWDTHPGSDILVPLKVS